MSSLSQIPQELLFNICEYGECPEELSSSYILQEIINIYPQINLGRELVIATVHDNLTRLKDDITKIYAILEPPLRHHLTFYFNRTLNRSGIRISCPYMTPPHRLKDDVSRITLDNFTFIDGDDVMLELIGIDISADELKTICTLVTRYDINPIMTMKRSCPDHTMLSRIANAHPSRDIDTINRLRSLRYPVGKIIQHARILRRFSDSFKTKGYNTDLFMGDNASILDMKLLRPPHIAVNHTTRIDQLISSLRYMGINLSVRRQYTQDQCVESTISWSGKGTNTTMRDVEAMLRDVRRMIQKHMSFSLSS
uniref:Uncharacterized protein n=1 Tax=viral metagenome TaxID=1070528 RepID=A0A6C0BM15_9ZZZZ